VRIPSQGEEQDYDQARSMDLLAGQGVGLVGEIKPAREIVRELVDEARQIVSKRLAGLAARGRLWH
jgi:hypothetical protein